jgi:hypothetical protein
MSFLSRWQKMLWWAGIPVITLLWTFAPYWAWNIMHEFSPWWRVFMIGGVVFDTPFYLEWIGEAVGGFAYGNYLKSFGTVLSGIARVLPHATVDEWWLVSGWLSAILFLFVAPWCFRQWASVGLWQSRAFTVGMWLSTCLILGLRPGIYSWYLPFCCLGITLALKAYRELEKKRVGQAILWSVLAAVCTSMYVWFLIATGMFLLVSWAVFLFRVWPKATWGILVAGIIATFPLGIFLSKQIFLPAHLIEMQMQERHGLAYTHMPFLSNSVLVTLGWIALLCVVLRLFRRDGEALRNLIPLQIMWCLTFLGFQLSVFTGIYIHNDHFRAPALLFSWLTLAALWKILPRPTTAISKWETRLTYAILAASSLYTAYILQQPYAFNGDYLNTLHLSHWFVLVFASVLVIFLQRGRTLSRNRFFAILLAGTVLIGGIPTLLVYRQEWRMRTEVLSQRPLVEWVQTNVPRTDALCADPKTAEFLSAHAERRVYPAPHTRVLPESNDAVLQRTILLASAYDVIGSGYLDEFMYLSDVYRATACVQYPLQSKILRLFGASQTRIWEQIGCPRPWLNADREVVTQAIAARKVDGTAFAQTCPWVIIPANQRDFWKVPQNYVETRLDTTSIWHYSPSL